MLRNRLEKKVSSEMKSRIQVILDDLRPPFTTFPSEPLRRYREIEVLERVGSEEARALLKEAESEAPSALVREQARLALERLSWASKKGK